MPSYLPTCPYCAGPLTPAAYCATCRMSVAPYPGMDNHGYTRIRRESARRGNLASAQARRKEPER